MKKLLYTLLAVSIIFTACKKEDEKPAIAPLIGLWDMEFMENELDTIWNGTDSGRQYHFFESGYLHYILNGTVQDIVQYTYTNTQIIIIDEAALNADVTYYISPTSNLLTLFYNYEDESFLDLTMTFSKH